MLTILRMSGSADGSLESLSPERRSEKRAEATGQGGNRQLRCQWLVRFDNFPKPKNQSAGSHA